MSPEPVYKLQRRRSACAHTTQPLTGSSRRDEKSPPTEPLPLRGCFISHESNSNDPLRCMTRLTKPRIQSRWRFRRCLPATALMKNRGFATFLTVSDSLLRPLVMNVNPCVSMATPVFCMCSSTYLKRKATGIRRVCELRMMISKAAMISC